MTILLDPEDPNFTLGVSVMDETHREFMDLVNKLGNTGNKEEFISLFAQLVKHTEEHFDNENKLMEQTGFPPIREHMGEHLRLLGELHRFAARVSQGSIMLGQSYIKERLPDWFKLHAATMDSALAMHLKMSSQ